MKMYCCEFENTKDGSLNFEPSNLLNRQLIFTRHLTQYQKKNYRWIEYLTEADHSQEEIIEDFKIKFGVDVKWEQIEDTKGHVWNAWIIHERDLRRDPNLKVLDHFFFGAK